MELGMIANKIVALQENGKTSTMVKEVFRNKKNLASDKKMFTNRLWI